METAAQSGDQEIVEELLRFYVEQKERECFAAMLFTCYDLIRPDVALEVSPLPLAQGPFLLDMGCFCEVIAPTLCPLGPESGDLVRGKVAQHGTKRRQHNTSRRMSDAAFSEMGESKGSNRQSLPGHLLNPRKSLNDESLESDRGL